MIYRCYQAPPGMADPKVICTLPEGHDDCHVAQLLGGQPIAFWSDTDERPTFLVPEEWPVAASQRVVIEYVDPQIPISETVVVKRWEIVKDCLFLRITDEESQVVPLSQIRRWRSVAIETDGDR